MLAGLEKSLEGDGTLTDTVRPSWRAAAGLDRYDMQKEYLTRGFSFLGGATGPSISQFCLYAWRTSANVAVRTLPAEQFHASSLGSAI